MSSTTNIESKAEAKVEEAEKVAQKTHTSKGAKLFDLFTYGGVSFLGVFIATMPFTYWTKHGGGKKFHSWLTNTLKNKGVSDNVAEQTFNTAVLGSLGNVVIIPIKILENNKPAIVEKLNAMVGDKSGDASVDQEPKQSWGSLILGRVAAYTSVFVSLQGAVTLWGGENFKKFEERFAENIVCKPLGKPTHTPGMAKIVENETKAFRYGKIGALDVFATAAATLLLYVGSKFLAARNERWHASDLPKDSSRHDVEQQKQDNVATTIATSSITTGSNKLFTNSITTQTSELMTKPCAGSKIKDTGWAETITDQKAATTPASSISV